MEEIIDKLIELEQRAQKITNTAKEKEKTISEQIGKKQIELEQTIISNYQKKIDDMKNRESLDEQQKLNDIDIKSKEALGYIESNFEQNHIKWEEELFNSIVGW